MRELLTIEETAERLRVSVPTVRWLRQEGKLPKAYKVGRRVLWDPRDLDAWLEDQRDPDCRREHPADRARRDRPLPGEVEVART